MSIGGPAPAIYGNVDLFVQGTGGCVNFVKAPGEEWKYLVHCDYGAAGVLLLLSLAITPPSSKYATLAE